MLKNKPAELSIFDRNRSRAGGGKTDDKYIQIYLKNKIQSKKN
jgi:hypothetical protein